MKRKGRPSTAKKQLKNGFYIQIKNGNAKPMRLMRETMEGVEMAKEQFKNKNFKYLGQVENNVWLDGEMKGEKTA